MAYKFTNKICKIKWNTYLEFNEGANLVTLDLYGRSYGPFEVGGPQGIFFLKPQMVDNVIAIYNFEGMVYW